MTRRHAAAELLLEMGIIDCVKAALRARNQKTEIVKDCEHCTCTAWMRTGGARRQDGTSPNQQLFPVAKCDAPCARKSSHISCSKDICAATSYTIPHCWRRPRAKRGRSKRRLHCEARAALLEASCKVAEQLESTMMLRPSRPVPPLRTPGVKTEKKRRLAAWTKRDDLSFLFYAYQYNYTRCLP